MTARADQPQWIHLSDGRDIPYRPIRPEDAPGLQAFHLSQSPRTQYQRFFGHYPVLSDRQAERFTNVDGHNRIALVALDPDNEETIIGVVRLERDGHSASAEYAAVVTDRWQGIGLGHGLTVALLAEARKHQIGTVYALVMPQNQPMLALLKGLGKPWRVTFEEGFERIALELGTDDEEEP